MKYNANHTRAVPANRKLDLKTIRSISGANGTSAFYVELAKLNNIYDAVYRQQQEAIKAASPYISNRHITFEPIDMIYDLDLVQIGNSFNRGGKEQLTGQSFVLIRRLFLIGTG